MIKKCNKCNAEFPATLDFFHKRSGVKCGLSPSCKKCVSLLAEKAREFNIKNNIQKTCTKCKKTFPATNQFFSNQNVKKDGLRVHCVKCRKNPNARWRRLPHGQRISNKETNRRRIEIRKADPIKKLVHGCRRRVLCAVKAANAHKHLKTMDLIGCSPAFLKEYLESLFKPNMGWYNHGNMAGDRELGWEIDHLRPCASFDLSRPEEQLKCFNYKNLQPLWRYENRAKKHYYSEG